MTNDPRFLLIDKPIAIDVFVIGTAYSYCLKCLSQTTAHAAFLEALPAVVQYLRVYRSS